MTASRLATFCLALGLGAAHVLVPIRSRGATVPNETFVSCDGYGHPGGSGDGITRDPAIWGIVPGLPAVERREDISLTMGETGLDACTAALADDRISSASIWMRKVSLLRARALHRLALNDPAGALADLDLATAAAAGHSDAYYDRSLGLGVDMVRAYALRKKGDKAAGEALAMATWERRPYNIQVGLAASRALGAGGDPADIETVNRGLASIDPRWLDILFQQMMNAWRFADVVALYPQLAPTTKQDTSLYGAKLVGVAELNRVATEAFWFARGGQTAYALAALGEGEKARAMLQSTQARFVAATAPPPDPAPDPNGQPPKPDKMAPVILKDNAMLNTRAAPVMVLMTRLVELRMLANEGKVDEVADAVLAPGFPGGSQAEDLVTAVIGRLTPANASLKPKLEAAKARFAAMRRPTADPTPADVFNSLPDAESSIKVPSFRRVGPMNGFLSGGDNGYRVNVDDQRVNHLTFRGHVSSRTIIEEMALLAAVDTARANSARGIVILKSRDVEHSITTRSMYTAPSSSADGWETDVEFVYVDPAAPPPEYSQTPWRILSVDTVYASLSPFYIRTGK